MNVLKIIPEYEATQIIFSTGENMRGIFPDVQQNKVCRIAKKFLEKNQ